MGIKESILANLVDSNPSKNLVIALNRYAQWIDENTITEDICLLNNDDCCNDGESMKKAINSHLISKGANLKPISKDKKVRTIATNYENPLINKLKDTPIKKATVFPGFCKYHDKFIFEPLESKKVTSYTNEHFFLLTLRAIANEKYKSEKIYKQTKLINKSFNNEIVKDMLKECNIHNECIKSILDNKTNNKFTKLCYYFKENLKFKHDIKKTNKIVYEDYIVFKQLSNDFIGMLQNKDYSQVRFKQYTIKEKKIAFSSAYRIPFKKNNLFIFLFILPNDKESNILIGCLDRDFKLLIEDKNIKQCFDGQIDKIQELINFDSDAIVFNGDDFNDYEYAKYIYETNNQIKKIFPPNIIK